MGYIENPKTKGSGIICCIPQSTRCPLNCEDCFFQSGRSYLEPLEDHLPNMPTLTESINKVVRVNDGNDSNVDKETVLNSTINYPMKFYNTSIPQLDDFNAPVVLTVNPGIQTDHHADLLSKIPDNLMFIRVRTNTWNIDLVDRVVNYYTYCTPLTSTFHVPVILTFMAYHKIDSIPLDHRINYIHRKRTMNSYFAITTNVWRNVMDRYRINEYVYSCGKIEGEFGDTHCTRCGNCLREYFNTIERMKNGK